ncbi:hypothetical protein TU51_04670 [Bacillus cytotoxicus]|uniref:class I SAM-dependent methyltransferase n=1 Tax=Bacillus cytotoxicus TaxID=580165 RepID=UPI00065F7AE1|nr:class I SAM-dependent methyltransferase [Bacillus cytotoxicus]AWC31812.1 class I SAM-dependent methyltransferase [Bacillus cytotoxicus]AWC35850.1 class I SAM-dependent methyltransferase [Bacillus cytotoxicus]AWC60089.1 class I SAM-dependent methyltransferase [Bacillus cytotoxicus]KMT50309.1 hypothetical protein TU51_04670 [Bacillus cytotoxicus]HDR7308177.1 class I SAM-dependent methyltransferase [Bacillus cytotoxicus]
MQWVYHNPVFDVDYVHPSIRLSSAWVGHNHFAYDFIRFMKPKKVVELGTHYGSSFYRFCQGIKDEQLSAECFAVDTWKGDLHSGPYGENVFEMVSYVTNHCYPTIGRLIRSTFDDALHLFEDESIDVLHIDGYHTFEAVSHDFETWLPKVSKNGAVLFHDIAVLDRDFGVYKLWETLKKQHPYLEFSHSYGLGVLFPKGYDNKFQDVFDKKEELQRKYAGSNI